MFSLSSTIPLLLASPILVQGQTEHPYVPCGGDTQSCMIQVLLGQNSLVPGRLADCSSYQNVVVTPATKLVYHLIPFQHKSLKNESRTVTAILGVKTITVTMSGTPPAHSTARPTPRALITAAATANPTLAIAQLAMTSLPSILPGYLGQGCNVAEIYASACACLGVPRNTLVAPVATVTTSLSMTTTSTLFLAVRNVVTSPTHTVAAFSGNEPAPGPVGGAWTSKVGPGEEAVLYSAIRHM
ncbi:hypothetical protein N7532_006316 [Penicillium argentinense]|uniref:Uncharacterized protein n=1 Tax=Penicillium argentinense TaxID=1131581 RepID=A0A9W9KAR6_9EURO|nr:uncharacterized protein N7532_006316 [Penicillium argentinense]KAJ5099315.1 hypothetical protein N7532_006316 [Penicillium argentinense]